MKYSSRMDWDFIPNRLFRILEEKRGKGEALIDLTASNPTKGGFAYAPGILGSCLSDPGISVYDPNPRGSRSARKIIADDYLKHGIDIDAGDIFLTSCTSEAYSVLFKLLGNAGDTILIPRPGYPLIPFLAKLETLEPIYYPLRMDNSGSWTIDFEILEGLIMPSTKAIVFVNPNNPTGNYLKPSDVDRLETLCNRYGIALIVDEVFSDFLNPLFSDIRPSACGSRKAPVFILNGISKMLGLPQVKLGWIVVCGPDSLKKKIGSNLELILDFYLTVGVQVQAGIDGLFRLKNGFQEAMGNRIDTNWKTLEERISGRDSIRLLPREGGWYGVLEFYDPVYDEDRERILLEKDNVLAHTGYFFDFPMDGFLILSLIVEEALFSKGVDRIIRRFFE